MRWSLYICDRYECARGNESRCFYIPFRNIKLIDVNQYPRHPNKRRNNKVGERECEIANKKTKNSKLIRFDE